MERPRSRGALNQKKYRDRVREENEENTKFRKFANEPAPWLVEMFLAETKVSNINEKRNPKLLQNLVNKYHIVSFPFLAGISTQARGSN